jgi:hypothetical protein
MDDSLQGKIYSGQFPFESEESDYDYARYRYGRDIESGVGKPRVLDKFFASTPKYNANGWPYDPSEASMVLGYRLELMRLVNKASGKGGAACEWLGFYDGRVGITGDSGGISRVNTITEGPFVTRLNSDTPGKVVFVWETDMHRNGEDWQVLLAGPYEAGTESPETGDFAASQAEYMMEKVTENPGTDRAYVLYQHSMRVTGLQPDSRYFYYVQGTNMPAGVPVRTPIYPFTTAPRPGEGSVSFAFASDSREGGMGGLQNYMGVNFGIMSWTARDAYRRGADFYIFGGDLINGYTSETWDFRLQLKAWKQATMGFWRSRPVYPAMGNHETLINRFGDIMGYGITLDKWPYSTDSAEAIFAEQFWNPVNGPKPSDPRRPTYDENVYSFQYGPVLCIAFNNNYWYSRDEYSARYGGSPEGYMMDDQLDWIEKALAEAESDRSVRYIVLYAQEPVWPNGGHVKDAMWYYGDNNVAAFTSKADKMVQDPAGGIIEVRNRFWEAVAKSSKTAAVLVGDEHNYHRTLIDKTTPVGLYPQDDTDGDGKLDTYSPNPAFKFPVWHLCAGTAGAPYYAEEKTPWQDAGYMKRFSSQQGYLMLHADKRRISAEFITKTGQVLDKVDNLMAIRNDR